MNNSKEQEIIKALSVNYFHYMTADYKKIIRLGLCQQLIGKIEEVLLKYIENDNTNEIILNNKYIKILYQMEYVNIIVYKGKEQAEDGLYCGDIIKDSVFINDKAMTLSVIAHELIHLFQEQMFYNYKTMGIEEEKIMHSIYNDVMMCYKSKWEEQMAFSKQDEVESILKDYIDENALLKSDNTKEVLNDVYEKKMSKNNNIRYYVVNKAEERMEIEERAYEENQKDSKYSVGVILDELDELRDIEYLNGNTTEHYEYTQYE